ncbi:MAG TPA: type II toxin-antitoxin system VapC family toxin [Acidimicrobiales bacterium]|nr:type II toxin-antitoxin system VapC family toxin [Acidimicrobiales bacterium]
MILIDVNVLIYAYNAESPRHGEFRSWLSGVLDGDDPYGYSDLVLSGFVRLVTHPRVFDPPSELAPALEFAELNRSSPNAVRITPGDRHWDIFSRLCKASYARGNFVADAYHASLAIESGSEWITTDRGFARFGGLRWRHPLG